MLAVSIPNRFLPVPSTNQHLFHRERLDIWEMMVQTPSFSNPGTTIDCKKLEDRRKPSKRLLWDTLVYGSMTRQLSDFESLQLLNVIVEDLKLDSDLVGK